MFYCPTLSNSPSARPLARARAALPFFFLLFLDHNEGILLLLGLFFWTCCFVSTALCAVATHPVIYRSLHRPRDPSKLGEHYSYIECRPRKEKEKQFSRKDGPIFRPLSSLGDAISPRRRFDEKTFELDETNLEICINIFLSVRMDMLNQSNT